MNEFEYEVTTHRADQFQDAVYFCSATGQCELSQVPENQWRLMESLLNERGKNGWNLVQAAFGSDGMLAIWKREKATQ
ncbi:MAG: hypothetical protein ACLFOY_05300 [Desulfatibacillaceae bacterium]